MFALTAAIHILVCKECTKSLAIPFDASSSINVDNVSSALYQNIAIIYFKQK
ncbi:unnamed protein product [Brugia timori]|uniref:Uncharacterized protein n=1 Tax=Brugia timori TaxID=42155 RepID=A0A3P7WP18_9BILA|nr:unnamed protein product [Brugia timori]